MNMRHFAAPELAPPASDDDSTAPCVLLHARETAVLTQGARAVLRVPADGLGEAVAAHFDVVTDAAPALLAGALPFDRAAPCHLLAPERQWQAADIGGWLARRAGAGAPGSHWQLQAQPARADYEAAVAQCVADLRTDATLAKVVLARTLLARSRQPVDPWRLAHRLAADPAVLRYVVPLPTAADATPRWLVGATPELVLQRRGAHILSGPLAGSAPRLADAAASQGQAEALLRSAKDQREHRYVVQAIADLLAPLCRQLHVPSTPSLHATASMWHLGTRIEGELRDASPDALPTASSAALAALLHPTPAICGTPRQAAAAHIAALEPVPRGFYGGLVGWCDAQGDGQWYLALRCAEVQGEQARLYAGAGVIAASQAAAEGAETRAKFNAMLHALGVDAAALTEEL